jgi:hypothetical protein
MRGRAILTGLVILGAAACGGESGLTLPSSSTITGQTTLTTAPSTTVATTTTTATITSTSAPTTTTTTMLPQVVFDPDGIGFALFGEAPQAVIDLAQALWGPPATDTGVLPSEPDFCPGTQYRKLTWDLPGGTLKLLFTDDEPWSTGGQIVFTGYGYASPALVPITAGPPLSLDVGVTVADALAMWPQGAVFNSEMTGEDMFLYTPGYPTGILISGLVSGLGLSDVLTTVWGGRGCHGDEPGAD